MITTKISKNLEKLRSVGYIDGFLIENEFLRCNSVHPDGVEIININEALQKYNGLKDYFWRAADKDKDKFTKEVDQNLHNGCFIRTKAGIKISETIQSCFFISNQNFEQKIHNIIIAEENSELNIATGCLTGNEVSAALHIGVTEIYVKKGARVNFTMIHNWAKNVEVRPRTVVIVEDGGIFVSQYICANSVKLVQMNLECILKGEKARAIIKSFVSAPEESIFDIGAKVILDGKGSSAEILAKSVSEGGKVINRGKMVGNNIGIRSHMKCEGLIISPKGTITAIPEIQANLANLSMTHEASIGKISGDAIEYLQSRGMKENEAVSLIIRGFLEFYI